MFYLSQGEWNGAVLTQSGHDIIGEVARASLHQQVAQIDINGMADLAPTEAGQRRMAASRAQAVRDELIHDAVVVGDIVVVTYGAQNSAGNGIEVAPSAAKHRVEVIVHY